MGNEKIVDFAETGGLAEIGSEVFKGVLERGGCRMDEKFILD